jgi:hypothetical protein
MHNWVNVTIDQRASMLPVRKLIYQWLNSQLSKFNAACKKSWAVRVVVLD